MEQLLEVVSAAELAAEVAASAERQEAELAAAEVVVVEAVAVVAGVAEVEPEPRRLASSEPMFFLPTGSPADQEPLSVRVSTGRQIDLALAPHQE